MAGVGVVRIVRDVEVKIGFWRVLNAWFWFLHDMQKLHRPTNINHTSRFQRQERKIGCVRAVKDLVFGELCSDHNRWHR